MNNWHVYVVRCVDGSLYTGIARNVEARIKRHNEARGARFTKGRGPVYLIYSEPFPDKSRALRREIEIKQLSRRNKERLVNHRVSLATRCCDGVARDSHLEVKSGCFVGRHT